MVTFASYNDRQHFFVRDAWLVPLINSATSVLSGLVVFSVLGHLAHERGEAVEDVAAQGPGLAFVVYPEALALFPGANFFAIMFFLMLLCLGVDSAFALAETSLTCVSDFGLFPWLQMGPRAALYCLLCFFAGLLFVTRGGLLWLDLFDTYATAFALFVAAALECIGATWIYGSDRLARDIVGMAPSFAGPLSALLVHLKYVVPAILIIVLGFAFYDKTTLDFPQWAIGVGWTLSFVPILPIVAVLARHFASRCQRMTPPTSAPEIALGQLKDISQSGRAVQVT
uniref:Transporter n=1 Tax=Calcidiscus leptoporus TaxID=127549 RepID=A0A7S0J9Q0_9EUKA